MWQNFWKFCFLFPVFFHVFLLVFSLYTNRLLNNNILIFLNFNLFIQIYIIEKITMCFVLSLYDKSRFIFTIYLYIICLVLYSWNLCFLQLLEKKDFFLNLWSNNQLSCGIFRKIFTMQVGDYEQIINYDWPFCISSMYHQPSHHLAIHFQEYNGSAWFSSHWSDGAHVFMKLL